MTGRRIKRIAPFIKGETFCRFSSAGRRSGTFELRDQRECRYLLSCDAEHSSRTRFLKIETNGIHGTVDFAGYPAKITINRRKVEQPPAALAMDSTLRLELGAFLAQAAGSIASSPLTAGVDEMIALHAALEAFSG